MESTLRKSLICALAFLAAAPAVSHAATSNKHTTSVEVRYNDLDLSQPAGAAKMLRRLDVAATEACGASEGSLSDYVWAVHRSACHAKSLNRAVTALDAPELTALYDARLARPGGAAYISVN